MRKWNLGYLGAAALMALVGCSTSTKKIDRADQRQIYQQYSMTYETDSNRTSVVAQFREAGPNGETLELVAPAAIGHDSLELRPKSELGQKYTTDKAGFVKEHSFTFTDAAGKQYKNQFSIAEAKVPANLPARQSVDQAFTLVWEGEPVADDKDEVTLLVANTGAVGAVKPADRISVRKAGLRQIEIPLDRVQKLGEGKREIRFERKRNLKLQAGTDAGGYAETTYTSAPVTIEFFREKAAPADPKKDAKPEDKKDPATPAAEPKKEEATPAAEPKKEEATPAAEPKKEEVKPAAEPKKEEAKPAAEPKKEEQPAPNASTPPETAPAPTEVPPPSETPKA